MESVSSVYKQENDLVYIAGRINGRKEGREETDVPVVKNLLTRTDFSNEKIAQVADVSVYLVETMRIELANSKKQHFIANN